MKNKLILGLSLLLCTVFIHNTYSQKKENLTNSCEKHTKSTTEIQKKFKLFRKMKSDRKIERLDKRRRFFYAVGTGVSSRKSSSVSKARLDATKALALSISNLFKAVESNMFVEKDKKSQEVFSEFSGSITKMNFRDTPKTCEVTIEENGRYRSYFGIRVSVEKAQEAIIDLAENKEAEDSVRFEMETLGEYINFMGDE